MIARIYSPVRRVLRCAMVTALLALAVAAVAGPGQRKIDSLNFVNAEISTVLKSLADISGANIVISPNVKGVITVKLRSVTVDEALQVITKISGLSYAETNGTYVVDTQSAATTTLAQEYEIIKLRVISSSDAVNALKAPFKDVLVNELPDKRLLLVGNAARLNQAKTLLADIDAAAPLQLPGDGKTAEIISMPYQVKNLLSAQVKQYLEDEYRGQGMVVKYAPKTMWETSVESSRLILTGPKPVIEQALNALGSIDHDIAVSEKRVGVERILASHAIAYLLERYEARGLTIITAPMTTAQVSQVSGAAGGNAATAVASVKIGTTVQRSKEGVLNIDEPIGDFILRGPVSVVDDAAAALKTVDIGPKRLDFLYSLRYLKATEAKAKLDEMYGKDGLQVVLAPGRRGITPKMATDDGSGTATGGDDAKVNVVEVNDVTLRGPETIVARAIATLDEWDAEPPQISVGTEIISINSADLTNLGIVWGGLDGNTVTVGSVSTTLNELPSGDPLQLGRIVRSPISLNATLNALQTMNKAKIINRPATVVRNAQEATIHVGDTIYYETLVGYADNGPIIATASIDTGVTLQVRPIISKDNVITLEITANVTEPPTFRRSSSGSDLPSFRETKTSTVVQVRDGETLVIGGLMQTSKEINETAVPVLSKIPFLGNLFRSRKVTPRETELLIMVTPTVLRPGVVNPAGMPMVPAQVK